MPQLGRGFVAILAATTLSMLLVACSSGVTSPTASSKCRTSPPGMGGTWLGTMGGSQLTIRLEEECIGVQLLCTFCTSEWKVTGTWTWKDVSGTARYGSGFGNATIGLTRPAIPVSPSVLLEIVTTSGSPSQSLTVQVSGTLQTSTEQQRTDLRPPATAIELVRR